MAFAYVPILCRRWAWCIAGKNASLDRQYNEGVVKAKQVEQVCAKFEATVEARSRRGKSQDQSLNVDVSPSL